MNSNFYDPSVHICRSFTRFPAYLLFFLILLFPTIAKFNLAKAILLAIISSSIFLYWMFRAQTPCKLHPGVHLWTLFYVSVGAVFVLFGVLNNTPGAIRVTTVYIIWPIVFTVFAAGAADYRLLVGLSRIIVFASIIIGIFGIMFILHVGGLISYFPFLDLYEVQGAALYQGAIVVNFKPINTLFFSGPFLVAALLSWSRPVNPPVSRPWLWLAFSLVMVQVFLSSRETLIVLVLFSPVITIFFLSFMNTDAKRYRRRQIISFFVSSLSLLAFLGVALYYFYDFDYKLLLENLFFVFDFRRNPGAIARNEQALHLLNAFTDSPVFGAGHGAAVDYFRSEKHAWAYELSYVALLYQVGVFGFVAYSAGVVWIYYMGIRILKRGGRLAFLMLPTLVGMTCFLLANATNPYLATFDFIWVIFLPIGIINYWLVCTNRSSISFPRRNNFSCVV